MTRRYALYVLTLLTAVNFFNYVDRMVVVSMFPHLRERFELSNFQLSVVSGSFFVVHAVTTFPLGWMADRYNRVLILGLAVVSWSLATLGSAYAIGFLTLTLFRSLIGIGEAAYGPISNALLAETCPPEKKAKIIGIFNGGMFAGACIGVGGGAIMGFPLAFQVVAIPGIVLGILCFFLKVPKRRVDTGEHPHMTFKQVMRDFWRITHTRTMRWMVASGILISFAVGAAITWVTDFINKEKGMSLEHASMTLGIITLTGGVLGAVTGGWVADRLQRRWVWGRTLTIAIGFFASVPFSLVYIYRDLGVIFFICAWLQMFFLPWYNGPMAAVVDDIVDDKDANSAQAATAFWYHFVGTGGGAMVVGFVSDYISLKNALLIPTAATFLSAVCALIACKYVGADMEARRQRALAYAASRPAA